MLPVVGEIAIDGVTAIAVWQTRFVFESDSVSRYEPANADVGTMNHVVSVYALAPELETVVGPNDAMATLLKVAPVIWVKPVTVNVTLLPDATVAGATTDGEPSTVTVVDAVSTGVLLPAVPTWNCSVYAPGETVAGMTNVTPADVPNDPVSAIVTVAVDSVTAATSVDPE